MRTNAVGPRRVKGRLRAREHVITISGFHSQRAGLCLMTGSSIIVSAEQQVMRDQDALGTAVAVLLRRSPRVGRTCFAVARPGPRGRDEARLAMAMCVFRAAPQRR